MSDLFHPAVPDGYIRQVVDVMLSASWHTYQVLTKRADRLHSLLSSLLKDTSGVDNIWWGVSVENRRHGLPRVSLLRDSPARTRFLSVEPLLEDLGVLDLTGIQWVIVGGESGRGARPLRYEWVTAIRDQCSAAQIPFFFKQWGGVNKVRNGRDLDGRTHDEMPRCASQAHPFHRASASV
jgi:protein gp37